jgi:hypothetical protein
MGFPRKLRHGGLALVAVLALCGISAASASAAEFQAQPSFPVRFTANGGAGFLETAAGRVVTCLHTEGSGEVASSTEVKNVQVRFKQCFAERLALLTCTSPGAASGEIVTNAIKATPVDLDAGHSEAGLLLQSEAGGLFVTFQCALGPVQETLSVKGSVIGKVPTNELGEFRETLNLEFRQSGGTPEPSLVEGAGEPHVLLTKGEGTEPFEYETSGIQELMAGEATTTALEGKKVKLVP